MSDSICAAGGFATVDDWVLYGGFLLIIVTIIDLFWAFAFICEEYCIPAITILCKRYRISDDIAGAIFIGAGLSAPPLFVSFIGLFLSNASIGASTVIGGDIFNHLINMSASVLVSPRKCLQLNGWGLTREVFFYAASIIILIYSIKGNLVTGIISGVKASTWLSCLHVRWYESFVLVICYVVYAISVVYIPRLTDWFFPSSSSLSAAVAVSTNDEEAGTEEDINRRTPSYHPNDSIDETDHAFAEPDGDGYIRLNPNYLPISVPPESIIVGIQNQHENNTSIRNVHNDDSAVQTKETHCLVSKELSRHTKDIFLSDINNDFPLYKKSSFYVKYDFGCVPRSRQWKIRYFTANAYGLYYRLAEDLPRHGPHVRFINMFQADAVEVVDHLTLEFCIVMRRNGRKSSKLNFQAVDLSTFEKIILFCNKFIASCANKGSEERHALAAAAIFAVSNGTGVVFSPESEAVDDQLFLPPASIHRKILYYLSLPLRYVMHFTIPDVRKQRHSNKSVLAISACILWIFLFSWALIASLNTLANVAKVSGSIMGYTIGAWAASYPALWSSVVLAKHDFGDMASCNALGSNTFTNFIGLGLPWLTYSIINSGQSYVFEDDGVVLALLALLSVLVVYYIAVALSRWQVRLWMVPPMLLGYVVIVAYLIFYSI